MGNVDVLLVTCDVRLNILRKRLFFIPSTFIIRLFILKFELKLYQVLARTGQASRDTLGFALGRSGRVTVGIRALDLEIYLGDILELYLENRNEIT